MVSFMNPLVMVGAFGLVMFLIFMMVRRGISAERGLENAEEKGEEKLIRLEKDEMQKLERAMQGEELESKLEQMEFTNEQKLYVILSKILQALSSAFRNPPYTNQIIKANINLYKLALSTAETIQKELKEEQKGTTREISEEVGIEREEKEEFRTEKQIEAEEIAESRFSSDAMNRRELMIEKAETKKAEAETAQEVRTTKEEESEERQKLKLVGRELGLVNMLVKSITFMIESLRKGDIKKGYQTCAGMIRAIQQLESLDKYNISVSQRIEMDIRKDEQLDQTEEARNIGLARRIKQKARRLSGKKRLF